jgi:hypothetical protein
MTATAIMDSIALTMVFVMKKILIVRVITIVRLDIPVQVMAFVMSRRWAVMTTGIVTTASFVLQMVDVIVITVSV